MPAPRGWDAWAATLHGSRGATAVPLARRRIVQLVEALRQPGRTVSRLGALGWRLRRNYVWIYAAVLITWLGKLDLSGEPTLEPRVLVTRAAFGSIPGGFVVAIVALFYAFLLAVALGAHLSYPLGDDEARQLMEDVTEE